MRNVPGYKGPQTEQEHRTMASIWAAYQENRQFSIRYPPGEDVWEYGPLSRIEE